MGLKDHVLDDALYMKCPEKTNPEKQKANQWLPWTGRAGGKGERALMGAGFQIEVLKMLWNQCRWDVQL